MEYVFDNNEKLRIGYRTPGFSGKYDFAGKMALAKELGFPVVEPQVVPRELPDVAAARDYRKAADDAGIEVATCGYMPPLTDPAKRSEIPDEIKRMIEFVKALEVDYVFVCAQHPPEGILQPDTWALLSDNLRLAADETEKAGISLAVEPEWFIGSVERMVRLVKRLGHSNIRINFDPTNFYLNGSDPESIFDFCGDLVSNGHIKDGVYRTGEVHEVPIGTGEVDYPAIFTRIKNRRKSIDMHIEHLGEKEPLVKARDFVKKLLDSLFA